MNVIHENPIYKAYEEMLEYNKFNAQNLTNWVNPKLAYKGDVFSNKNFNIEVDDFKSISNSLNVTVCMIQKFDKQTVISCRINKNIIKN